VLGSAGTNSFAAAAATRRSGSRIGSATLTTLCQTYWIPAAHQFSRSILHQCVTCLRVIRKSYSSPDPPPLPYLHMQDVHPFTYTGVDFSGALYVTQAKQWRCTCAFYLCYHPCRTFTKSKSWNISLSLLQACWVEIAASDFGIWQQFHIQVHVCN